MVKSSLTTTAKDYALLLEQALALITEIDQNQATAEVSVSVGSVPGLWRVRIALQFLTGPLERSSWQVEKALADIRVGLCEYQGWICQHQGLKHELEKMLGQNF